MRGGAASTGVPTLWVSWVAQENSSASLEAISREQAFDLADMATYVVQEAVNEELRGHVGVVLHPFLGGALRMWADSLLAFVYLSFASSLGPAASAHPARHRICLYDSRPFIPGRRDQFYCDKRCRERAAYRRRTAAMITER